jgi:hypothetical protein
MNRTGLIATLALLALAGVCGAAILNVPDDYATIQRGINAADDGDTVLVQPGTYQENIDFGGSNVVVGSLFLTTGDTTYIDSTIIDGDANGRSVVAFQREEDSNAYLTGFTITNGSTDYGGGIYISDASPILHHLKIVGNESSSQGGGIYCTQGAGPMLNYLTVADNSAGTNGGGISGYNNAAPVIYNSTIIGNQCIYDGGGVHFASGCDATLSEVEISSNEAGRDGGGLFLCGGTNCNISGGEIRENTAAGYGGGIFSYSSRSGADHVRIFRNAAGRDGNAAGVTSNSQLDFTNCTVTRNNSANNSIYIVNSRSNLLNSILWDNEGYEIYGSGADAVVAFTDVDRGERGIGGGDIEYGEGNIDADPLFLDPDSDDYHLAGNSPCIDAGDPNSPLDPDSTCADMGAFYFSQMGVLQGYVYDSIDDLPLSQALLFSDWGDTAYTDSSGFYQFSGIALGADGLMTARMVGFVDSVVTGIHIVPDDTVQVDFRLWHPIPTGSSDVGVITVAPGDSARGTLTLGNTGNYRLVWSLSKQLPDEPEPWLLLASYPFGETVQDRRLSGAVFGGDRFYVTGGDPQDNDSNWVYAFSRDGELVDMFEQAGTSRNGMSDLAWDGELIWGSGEQTVYGFDAGGTLIHQWNGPERINQALAWDSDRELLWITSITSNEIAAYDRDGGRVTSVDQPGWLIYGLAYRSNDPDGCPLYAVHTALGDNNRFQLHKFNPETGDTVFVHEFATEDPARVISADVSADFSLFTTAFLSVIDNGESDSVDVWFLDADPTWLTANPVEGTLEPGASEEISLMLFTAGLDTGEYGAIINLQFPEIRTSLDLPVTMRVEPNSIADCRLQNEDFGLGEAKPNPFNASFAVSYQLSAVSRVSLKLYDVTGRLVSNQELGIRNAGSHRAIINGERLASGVYLLKLAAGKEMVARKVVCVK